MVTRTGLGEMRTDVPPSRNWLSSQLGFSREIHSCTWASSLLLRSCPFKGNGRCCQAIPRHTDLQGQGPESPLAVVQINSLYDRRVFNAWARTLERRSFFSHRTSSSYWWVPTICHPIESPWPSRHYITLTVLDTSVSFDMFPVSNALLLLGGVYVLRRIYCVWNALRVRTTTTYPL
jgi:hypothetical protein